MKLERCYETVLFRVRRMSAPSLISALDWPVTKSDKKAHTPHYVVTPRECSKKADTAGFALGDSFSTFEGRRRQVRRRAEILESVGLRRAAISTSVARVVVVSMLHKDGCGPFSTIRTLRRLRCTFISCKGARHRAHAAMVLPAPCWDVMSTDLHMVIL